MNVNKLLSDFLKFEATRTDLVQEFGDDLLNAVGPVKTVSVNDVVLAIDRYLNCTITKDRLVDWVNTLWFSDLFEYDDEYADSIASVMAILETLDEDDVVLTNQDFSKMKTCLLKNQEYQGR